MTETQIRVNAPQVVHETIDGEVIIINLTSGNYYSLKGSGTDVWDVIQSSPAVSELEVVEAVASRYTAPKDEIEAAVSGFVREMREEGLVVDADPAAGGERPVSAATSSDEKRSVFLPPALEKFTDMQDLVLLDPVHEVDATGWPQALPPDATVSSPSA